MITSVSKVSSVNSKEMIQTVSTYNIDSRFKTPQTKPQAQPQFMGGPVDLILSGVQACEAIPMLNVTVLDLATAIVPRTIIESQTNAYAGAEAFRRESSGLIVNCLIPSLIVFAIAQMISKPIMGSKSLMASSWANGETINMVSKYWQEAQKLPGDDRAKVSSTIKNVLRDLEGVDGKTKVKFADKKFNFDKSVEDLTNTVMNPSKYSKKELKELNKVVLKTITEQTKAEKSLSIAKEGKAFSGSLESITKQMPKILREFVEKGIKDQAGIDDFVKRSTKLVNAKSFLGLGVIIPLAVSMQSINRWITQKSSGKKGAPIYKDYEGTKSRELTSKDKRELFTQKLISVGAMVGVGLLSMAMDKAPSGAKFKLANLLPDRKTFQFSGMFPTMDQARIISTATFASRMMAAEDKNELKEATVRDIATFGAFYFLGDYVAKGIATAIQHFKKDKVLINEPFEYKGTNALGKFWHWAKNTSLKSTAELATPELKNLRSACQLGNIAFSLIALGIVIPKITRSKTEKSEAAKKQAALSAENAASKVDKSSIDSGDAFKSYLTSK